MSSNMTGLKTMLHFVVKVVSGGWPWKRARVCSVVCVKSITKQGKMRSMHCNSEKHKQSVRKELLQWASWLQEIDEKAEVAEEVLVQAFYFTAKQEISNMKVLPMIESLTRYGIQDMKYFTHRSERCMQEIFLAIGQVL